MARRTFTTELKTAAAKLVTEQGYTPAFHGSSVVPIDAKGLQVENHRLHEENLRLLLEREISKEATVFFVKKQS
jgi:transposase-like protein